MSFISRHKADNSGRLHSGGVWHDCPIEAIETGAVDGIYMFDDFTQFPHITTPTITTQAAIGGKLGYKAFGSSGGTLISGGSQWGDVVLTESDDNEGVSIATIALPFKIIRGGGDFWFEARLKSNTVTNTENGFFLGLLDSATLSATVPIAAAGTLADENFVGFHRLEGDGDQIDSVYKADSVTQVSVQTDALPTALTADTYIKLGMRYRDSDYTFLWYANGTAFTSTKTIPSAAGTDFPNDVTMGLVLAMLCASNNDAITTMDWWAAAATAVSP